MPQPRRLSRRPSFEGLQVGDEVSNLVGIEAKFGHGRMSGHEFFAQCFLEGFDGIAFVKGSEGRGDLERTRVTLSMLWHFAQ